LIKDITWRDRLEDHELKQLIDQVLTTTGSPEEIVSEATFNIGINGVEKESIESLFSIINHHVRSLEGKLSSLIAERETS